MFGNGLNVILKPAMYFSVCVQTDYFTSSNQMLFCYNQLLCPQQFGYRQKYATESANCYLLEKIKTSLDKGNVVGAVFLDLEKANKLKKFKFSPEALKWLKSYLEGRQQCVRVNGVKSSMLANSMGVPQGSVLGPLLFTMYINDLPNCCPSVNYKMYADDTIIHVSTKTPSLAGEHMTQALSNISAWPESSHLKKKNCPFASPCVTGLIMKYFRSGLRRKSLK